MTDCIAKRLLGIFAVLLVVCVCEVLWCAQALANSITNIRVTDYTEKTRIEFEMQNFPQYEVNLNRDKLQYEVRIKNIDDPSKKFNKLRIKNSSIIAGLTRGTRTHEIVYTFKLKKPVTPVTYAFRKNSSSAHRVVIDFPHKVTRSTTTAKPTNSQHTTSKVTVSHANNTTTKTTVTQTSTTTVKAKNNENGVTKVNNIKELDAALYADLNSADDSAEPKQLGKRLAAPNPSKATKKKLKTYTIVIDPGHGGEDPGAIGKNGMYEKQVTLSISKYLRDYINSDPNMRGYLTRSTDKFIELGARSEIARKHQADVLISIHADSAANSKAQGATILVLSNQRADRENSKLEKKTDKHKDLLGGVGEVITNNGQENKYFKSMILDLASDSARNEGYNLAKEILNALYQRGITVRKREPIHRSLAVLKAPDIPSLLIETGYLSNYEEAQLLRTEKYRKQVAYSIYLGIREYMRKNPLAVQASSEATKPSKPAKTTSSARATTKYTVVRGDTLNSIATRFGTTVANLKKLNKITKNQVFIGQTLIVPGVK